MNPVRIHEILEVLASWKFIGYLCLGYPQAELDLPELERANWEHRRRPAEFTARR